MGLGCKAFKLVLVAACKVGTQNAVGLGNLLELADQGANFTESRRNLKQSQW